MGQPRERIHTFLLPRKIVFGCGALSGIGKEVAALGSRALLVTGRSAMRKSGALDEAVRSLKDAGVDVLHFDEVTPEPTVGQADAARDLARREQCDVVVGLGGGSALDVAKAAAGMFHHTGSVAQVQRGESEPTKGIPFVGVPTTAGTGSEVTKNSVLTDPERHVKASARSDEWTAALAIVDPRLLVSLPPDLTAIVGMDALTHAVESVFSTGGTPTTEALALRGAQLMIAGLPSACADPRDIAARSDCALGSLTAGMAFANSGLGAVHGFAHPLGALCGLPHGVACAIMLPRVLAFNRDAAREKMRRLADAIGVGPPGGANGVIEKITELCASLRLPTRLRDVGVREDVLDEVAQQTLAASSLRYNPRPASHEDLVQVLREAF
ncbi:MAG: iron-containing alcohol dehydrogenase family protein [Armatimonadota bacterium]